MDVHELIPRLLRQHGVDVVFSMLGGTNCTWIATGVQHGHFRLVKTRHEETAVNAAVGYSRASGTIGVASVTRGPGFANSINALIAATKSHVPILLIVGESPPTGNHFSEQSVDQAGFTRLIGAGFHHVAAPEDLEDTFWAALTDAYTFGRPQVLSTGEKVTGRDASTATFTLGPERRIVIDQEPDQDSIAAVVDVLERSANPLVLAGMGSVLSGAHDALVALADLVGARVTTTLRAHRFFDGHPHDLGICGTWSYPSVREYIAEADVVLAFGASLNRNTTGDLAMFPKAKVMHCEIDPDQPIKATNTDLALLGDAQTSAQMLAAEWSRRGLPRRSVSSPTPALAELRRSVADQDFGVDPARGLDVRDVLVALDAKLPANRVVVTDSGRTKAPASALVGAQDARSWLIGHGYASVGLGLGTAIGAASAQVGRPVALFCGDGGFMMALAGLDTARLHPELNLKVIILNDEQLGSELGHLKRHQLPLDTVRQDLPDVTVIAAIYGGRGTVLRTRDDLKTFSFLPHGLELVDARIDPFQDFGATFR